MSPVPPSFPFSNQIQKTEQKHAEWEAVVSSQSTHTGYSGRLAFLVWTSEPSMAPQWNHHPLLELWPHSHPLLTQWAGGCLQGSLFSACFLVSPFMINRLKLRCEADNWMSWLQGCQIWLRFKKQRTLQHAVIYIYTQQSATVKWFCNVKIPKIVATFEW